MIRRARLLCLCLVLASPVFAQAPATPDCAPAWTSWWTTTTPCAVGQVCADVFGFRIEVLAGDEARGYAIRDIDRHYCRGRATRADVVYTLGKDFRFPDCVLPFWWVQEFAAFAPGCYRASTVLSVVGGAITVKP